MTSIGGMRAPDRKPIMAAAGVLVVAAAIWAIWEGSGPSVQVSIQQANENAVKAFAAALPSAVIRGPASGQGLLPTPDDDPGWIPFGRVRAPAADSVPSDLSARIGMPNADTAGIIESTTSLADGRGAVATCDGRQRVIYYAPGWVEKLSVDAFGFIREHERAHHSLGHVTCGPTGPVFTPAHPDSEKKADCASVNHWSAFGAEGIWPLASASERFWNLNRPQDPYYPLDRVRSGYIRQVCK